MKKILKCIGIAVLAIIAVALITYATLMPELSKNWHIFAVDVYGHGESSHVPF